MGRSLSLYHSLFTGRAVLLDGWGRSVYQHYPCHLAQEQTYPLRHGVREKPDPAFLILQTTTPQKGVGTLFFHHGSVASFVCVNLS